MNDSAAVADISATPRIGLAANRWSRWSMYALMAFPIVDFGLRLHGIHPLGVIWDKLVLVLLIVLAVGRYLAGFRPYHFHWYKFAGWFMLFGLALMFAGMASPLVSVQGYRIDVYYLLYAFFIPFIVSAEDVPHLLHIGAMVAVLIAVHGIYQYITKAPTPTDWTDVSEHVRTRVYSVLQSPNELGSYMALMTPIVAGLAFYERDRRRKLLYAVGACLCACTLLLTFTRGAWIALALSVLLMAVLFERRLLWPLLIFAVVGYFLPPIHHRIQDLLSPIYWIKSSQSGRIARWLMAFDKMSSNPLFGIGLGHYGGAVSAIYHSGIYSDNYYAKTMGETGLVGLVLFISMHIALMRDILRHAVKRMMGGRERYVVIGGLTGLVAVLIHNSMENVFEYAPMAISYFVYASLFLIWGIGCARGKEHEDA